MKFKFTLFIIIVMLLTGCKNNTALPENSFNILVTNDNKDISNLIEAYMSTEYSDMKVNIDYDTTMGVIDRLNSNNSYDMVWLSNSIWTYMLNGTTNITNQKSTYITPIVYGVKKSKAKELGFIDKEVYMKDIIQAINSNNMSFIMSSCTQTNTGASAYLGILSTLSGNPDVLQNKDINNPELGTELKNTFSKVTRASGDDDYTIKLFTENDIDCIVTSEYKLIQMNEERVKNSLEEIYAIYPVDGVSFSDSPIAYIDRKDNKKFEIYEKVRKYITSSESMDILYKSGRRAGYGGEVDSEYKEKFNSEWGIINDKFISTIKYPSDKIIKDAFLLYQTSLKKPSMTIFCVDYSGSMSGEGEEQLEQAFINIMTDEFANANFISFGDTDYIGYVAFSSEIKGAELTDSKHKDDLIKSISTLESNGGTDIYLAMNFAEHMLIDKLSEIDNPNDYNIALVLMTDGQSSDGNMGDWMTERKSIQDINIPVFSITFGDTSNRQLDKISEMTGGQTFDGKSDLIKAFKTVRGYN